MKEIIALIAEPKGFTKEYSDGTTEFTAKQKIEKNIYGKLLVPNGYRFGIWEVLEEKERPTGRGTRRFLCLNTKTKEKQEFCLPYLRAKSGHGKKEKLQFDGDFSEIEFTYEDEKNIDPRFN